MEGKALVHLKLKCKHHISTLTLQYVFLDCHTNIVIPFTAIERDLPMSLTPECDMSGGDCEWKMTSDTVPITVEVGNATTMAGPKIIPKRTVGHNTEGDNNVNDRSDMNTAMLYKSSIQIVI